MKTTLKWTPKIRSDASFLSKLFNDVYFYVAFSIFFPSYIFEKHTVLFFKCLQFTVSFNQTKPR